MAERFEDRGAQSKIDVQNAQDGALTHLYTSQTLITRNGAAAEGHAELPRVVLANNAAKLCNFEGEMSKAQCDKSFPLYDRALSQLPSTPEQLAKIQDERRLTEDKWYHHVDIDDAEKNQYFQKLDLMSDAANMRFLYGVTLNNYGSKFNDETAKAKGLQLLNESHNLEPDNSEFVGALMQANRGEAVNYRKAFSEGAVKQAVSDLPRAEDEPKIVSIFSKDGFRQYVNTKLGDKTPQENYRLQHIAKVSSDLQWAVSAAPITTTEYVDKALKNLAPDSARILENALKENLRQ